MTEYNVTAEDVLRFWFEETPPQNWFAKSDAFDSAIESRFGDAVASMGAALEAGAVLSWGSGVRSILAAVILLDQFPRNIYRDTPDAFRFDPLALSLARSAINAGDDMKLKPAERSFLYMPLMHSEALSDQTQCVKLMESRVGLESNIHHAKEHCKVIERFGRFPHRNKILGRVSSVEEKAFLNDGGYMP